MNYRTKRKLWWGMIIGIGLGWLLIFTRPSPGDVAPDFGPPSAKPGTITYTFETPEYIVVDAVKFYMKKQFDFEFPKGEMRIECGSDPTIMHIKVKD